MYSQLVSTGALSNCSPGDERVIAVELLLHNQRKAGIVVFFQPTQAAGEAGGSPTDSRLSYSPNVS